MDAMLADAEEGGKAGYNHGQTERNTVLNNTRGLLYRPPTPLPHSLTAPAQASNIADEPAFASMRNYI